MGRWWGGCVPGGFRLQADGAQPAFEFLGACSVAVLNKGKAGARYWSKHLRKLTGYQYSVVALRFFHHLRLQHVRRHRRQKNLGERTDSEMRLEYFAVSK